MQKKIAKLIATVEYNADYEGKFSISEEKALIRDAFYSVGCAKPKISVKIRK